MGPVWRGVLQTEQVFAQTQIHELGQELGLVSYFDVASSQHPSKAGYGGPGHSGGDGDGLVHTINVGNFAAHTNGLLGSVCANYYVFDDDQQLEECCACPVTAHGVRTQSTINDLTSNPTFNRADLSLGAIKIVGSQGQCASIALPGFAITTAAFVTRGLLTEGLKAWTNHAETIASNLPPSFGFVTSTSVDEFQNAPLDSGELNALVSDCAFIVDEASGAGVCSCGIGDGDSGLR
jgi:hypothetical protein